MVDLAPDTELLRGTALIETLLEGLGEARAHLVEPGSFSNAVTTCEGRTLWADEAFLALVGEASASPDCRRLLRSARHDGRAAGLVTTARGTVVVEARTRERVGSWPLPPEARSALNETGERVVMIAFAPSRAPKLSLAAANALGLAPREAALAAALLEASSLEAASARIGMSPQTAKDALERACRRLGVRGSSELVGLLLDTACGAGEMDEATASGTLGLTAAEGRVASAAAKGWSVARTASALGLSETTVKSYRKAIFAKTGASRDRDLRRLFVEASRLAGLTGAAEIVLEERGRSERLRVVARPGGRRAVLIDYGPASGSPMLVMHGFTTGRRLPEPFVKRLQQDGWRPIVIQRPGFGLTDAARGEYLAESADDMAAVVEVLGGGRAALLARDGGIPTALAFATRHQAAFLRGGLINPRSTRERPRHGRGALASMSRLLLSQPALIAVVAEEVRGRTAGTQTRALMHRLYRAHGADRLAAERPDILDHLTRDMQAMTARSARGLIDELRVYAEGWRQPEALPSGPWRVAWGPEMWTENDAAAWSEAGADTRIIDDLGLLGAYTHPDALADLVKA